MRVEVIYLSDVYRDNPLGYAKPGDAGIDLRATEDLIIMPGQCILHSTGVRISIQDQNLFCMLLPRSSTGGKGLVLGNTAGVIDSGYQGELLTLLFNRLPPGDDNWIKVTKGERICQAIFIPFVSALLSPVETFSRQTERGTGGYGSTGKI